MKFLLPRLIFLLSSILLSLLLAEGIFYLFHYPSNASKPVYLPGALEIDPILGWKHRAGSFSYKNPNTNEEPFNVTFLSDGSRVTSGIVNQQSRKIAISGCSFVMGFGLDDRETFAWRLQELLPNYSIVNLGVGAYGSLHSLLRLKQYLSEQPAGMLPELIIYGFADFHPFRNIKNPGMHRYWDSKGIFPYCDLESCGLWEGKPMNGWYRSSRVFSMIENMLDSLKVRPEKEMAEKVTMKLILEMQALAFQKGSGFVVAPVSLEDDSWLIKFKNAKVPVFECDSAKLHTTSYTLSDGHPNALWSREFAGCLEKYIEGRVGS